jgi:hypothetical protein
VATRSFLFLAQIRDQSARPAGFPSGPDAWDGEQVLQGVREDIVNRPYEVPFRLSEEVRDSAEFRLAFADRAQRHLFGNGALTPKAVAARWMARAAEVDLAIIAESARWGGFRRDPPYTRDRDWLKEQARLLKTYFPQRTAFLLGQLRSAGLYPSLPAPELTVTTAPAGGSEITLNGSKAIVYWTTNGSDPREPGTGKVSASASPYATPIRLGKGQHLRCRALQDGVWSALVEHPSASNP